MFSATEKLKQTLKDFEERRVPVDVCAAIFNRTFGFAVIVWAQQDIYRPFSAGQVDRQTLKRGRDSS